MSQAPPFLAITVLAFGVLLLLTKKDKRRPDYLLLFWLGVFCVHLVTINGLESLPSLWFRFNTACSFLHGSVFFVYVNSLATNKRLGIPGYVHLGGVFLFGAAISGLGQPTPLLFNALIVLVYAALAAKMLGKQAAATHGFSPTLQTWLRLLLAGLLIVLAIPLFQALIDPDGLASSHNLMGTLAYCIFIVLLTFWGIRMAPILVAVGPVVVVSQVQSSRPRYEQSNLNSNQRAAIFQELEQAMAEDRLYLDAGLTLRTAAAKMNVNPNQLSEAINGSGGKNFNDYVNGFRVAAVCLRLDAGDNGQFTFLAIAYECGFNSKASFNRAFSKHTGQTPSQYVKAQDSA